MQDVWKRRDLSLDPLEIQLCKNRCNFYAWDNLQRSDEPVSSWTRYSGIGY